ncbi:GNAT family N-acetyltransferase [Guptibacillus algicola]|uniref:GNAT family N-acetyltransferase n=1 Tax=Guptibacillus algicola TaxID=225844 RepID=UPI001CD74FDC|nr:GNAT family N-acetyltransferase [Alkalihalobacillus algicola]MCA0988313.1 GNAT family N-acetyltransferase [Alkalihalobacillus algicola]
MKLRTFTNPKEYLSHVQSFLEENEALHSLPLGLLFRLVKQQQNGEEIGKVILGTIEEEDRINLCFIQTPPHNLVLASEQNSSEETLNFAAEELNKDYMFPGVLGEKTIVEHFSKKYCELSNCSRKLKMNQRIYRLDRVTPKERVEGKLRKAEKRDGALLKEWIQLFSYAMGEPLTNEESNERANQFIDEKTAVLWEKNGEVVSMANESRPTRRGTTINFVYTPPIHERKGYASANVAAFSQYLLDKGYQYCALYTDLSNPTSNSIYVKIGYRAVGDSIVYTFED